MRAVTIAFKARRHGAKHALTIARVAKKRNVDPALAFALVEQESGFRNIFGCDGGSILCHQEVTKDRVRKLLAFIDNGGNSNGVGLTQLTYPPFIRSAESKGGAHKPRCQLQVGLEVLKGNIDRLGYFQGLRAYNGTGPAADSYARVLTTRHKKWGIYLNG